MYSEYSLDTTNAAVYYIFDRDNESNMYSEAEKHIGILRNSRDNGIEANGLLLMSYPCIEAYIKLCVDDFSGELIASPKLLKQAVNDAKYQYAKLGEDSIIKACNNMLMGIRIICGRDLKTDDLDDFAEIGNKILVDENTLYLEKKQYMLLSLLSIAFIDLGLLSLD